MHFTIDAFSERDWNQVRAIYLEGIATGQATFETEAPTWEDWNASHLPFTRMAARADQHILGWAALSPVSRRKAYDGVAEVSVYIAAAARGQGIGTALLRQAIDESERNGIWTLQGGTFPENAASLKVQVACGFRIVGRRERIGCHHGVWRDTIITERRSLVIGAAQ